MRRGLLVFVTGLVIILSSLIPNVNAASNVEVTNAGFTYADGNPASIIKYGVLSYGGKLQNKGQTDRTPAVVIVRYEDGVLTDIEFTKRNLSAGESADIKVDMSIDYITENTEVSGYIFEGFDTGVPLTVTGIARGNSGKAIIDFAFGNDENKIYHYIDETNKKITFEVPRYHFAVWGTNVVGGGFGFGGRYVRVTVSPGASITCNTTTVPFANDTAPNVKNATIQFNDAKNPPVFTVTAQDGSQAVYTSEVYNYIAENFDGNVIISDENHKPVVVGKALGSLDVWSFSGSCTIAVENGKNGASSKVLKLSNNDAVCKIIKNGVLVTNWMDSKKESLTFDIKLVNSDMTHDDFNFNEWHNIKIDWYKDAQGVVHTAYLIDGEPNENAEALYQTTWRMANGVNFTAPAVGDMLIDNIRYTNSIN